MTDEESSDLTSYQKLKLQNEELVSKINSLLGQLESEKRERERVEYVAKINAILPEFKPSEEMDSQALRWVLHGLTIAPKANAKSQPELPDINPKPETPTWDGKPIPAEWESFKARYEQLPDEVLVE